MAFKDNTLEFFDNKIVDTETNIEVMMDWESPIMEKSAEFICHNKGDILEIGFGMGICADYIQAQGVNSHTIVEIHPQIIDKLKIWAEGKSNVIIVEGDWFDVEGLETYDGIFLDPYKGDNWKEFKNFTLDKIKSGGRITYWNMNPNGADNEFDYDNFSYKEIDIDVTDDDSYLQFNNNKYCIPMVEL